MSQTGHALRRRKQAAAGKENILAGAEPESAREKRFNELNGMTVNPLREIAGKYEIEGFEKMKKAVLVTAILNAEFVENPEE